MTDFSDRDARLYLARVAEYPAPQIRAYAADDGVITAASAIRAGTAPIDAQREADRSGISIEDDIRRIELGQPLLTPQQPGWPGFRLAALDPVDRPFAFWVRGCASLSGLLARAATITGSRAASSYGTTVATDFAHTVAEQGVTVVNGGSYGIDEAALRATVAARGRAVVILPCGVDQPYPTANAHLFDSVIDNGGLLISEYPLGTTPTRRRFAARARLLAVLSAVTVIVEAGRRSSAKLVAQVAHECGQPVLGVPGAISSATSTGVHELIDARTARMATSPDAILAAMRSPR
jgi:DNA processing protein